MNTSSLSNSVQEKIHRLDFLLNLNMATVKQVALITGGGETRQHPTNIQS